MRISIPRQMLGVFLLAMSACAEAQAPVPQDQNQTFTLSVSAEVVTVPVVVRDGKGKLVESLGKDDFSLMEDGKPQHIRYLTVDKDRPLTLGLLVDTSGSQKEYIAKERAASKVFFDAMLTRPEDTAFLVRFDNAITMMQVPTAAKDKLQTALGHLEDAHPPRLDPPGGTLLYDAVGMTCERVTRQVQGRNALVVLTDGHDNGSVVRLEGAIKSALLSNTVIYSILYSDGFDGYVEAEPGEAPMKGKEVLKKLSAETGGHMYEVSRGEPLEKILGAIADEMRQQYVLAYTPAKSAVSGFRKIELTGRDKSWKIQTRTGYFYYGAEAE